MSPAQIAAAKKLIGKMSREDIAKEVGASRSAFNRAFRGKHVVFYNRYSHNPNLVKRVCAYYEKNGRPATIKAFPDANVRSIVEHYGQRKGMIKPRTIRWTDSQLRELAKMGGLVSYQAQAKFFKRPRAYAGSIAAAWTKKFGYLSGEINGMKHNQARHFVTASCPFITVKLLKARKKTRFNYRKVYLWTDMEKHLRSDCPDFVVEAIKALANFQRWLFDVKDPRRAVIAMQKARE